MVSSRSLARALLFSHLVEHSSTMGLEIYAFSSLTDTAWHAYQQRTKVVFLNCIHFSVLLTVLAANVCHVE